MITVNDLSYTYPGSDAPVLKKLDFSIARGEIFGFLGPSGAGKSTCQKILYKVISDYEGEVIIDNKALAEWNSTYFERIGVGFELPNHYGKLSGRENLNLFATFYPKGRCQKIDALSEYFGLAPDMNKPVDSWSKGMKMRLNFIRAVMHDPEILFFDEPTSGLDPNNAHLIKQYILDLKAQGKTIFVTTHDMATADDLCDRVAFLVNGKIIVTDQPVTLKLKHGQDLIKVELKNGNEQSFPLSEIGQNATFLSFLKSAPVLRIHTQEATLEKVFIEVTGTALQS